MTDYDALNRALAAITAGVPHTVANLANASALLWEYLPDINWAGFYRLRGERLILGPFQGKPACIEIAVGRGVCGTAVAQNTSLVVPDVHAFPGHIACDSASRSEIVLPIHRGDTLFGVLDIDSPLTDRFSEQDLIGLQQFVTVLESALRGENEDVE